MISNFNSWLNESHKPTSKDDIKKCLDKLLIENYTINNDLSVDVDGDVNLNIEDFKYFPVTFNKVSGDFSCTGCTNLISLNGAPLEVKGYFSCRDCTSLTSLKGSPQEVGEYFYCGGCTSLTTLEGAPQDIGGDFYCNNTIFSNLFDNIEYRDFIKLSRDKQVKLYIEWIKSENLSKILTPEEFKKYRGIIHGKGFGI